MRKRKKALKRAIASKKALLLRMEQKWDMLLNSKRSRLWCEMMLKQIDHRRPGN